jgi:hypothetical protein
LGEEAAEIDLFSTVISYFRRFSAIKNNTVVFSDFFLPAKFAIFLTVFCFLLKFIFLSAVFVCRENIFCWLASHPRQVVSSPPPNLCRQSCSVFLPGQLGPVFIASHLRGGKVGKSWNLEWTRCN